MFEVGDFIEISGSLLGKVVIKKANWIGIQRIHYAIGLEQYFLAPEIEIYDNSIESYKEKHWIRKIDFDGWTKKTGTQSTFGKTKWPLLD
ncbi:hypothetical protein EQG49_12650 [Periweissella cryptocerci]|uniref:Uncharacterized protein n=1 Tax=Periweissella cryptocerci TaxID=2506420 RepID=A0A4P6YWU1_9LACO|nr:hypothetical protein [Periweissella cryptocerci]QBO37247.1 hypothetical protein EQG49_12650 [Periweissella cryptocerci]